MAIYGSKVTLHATFYGFKKWENEEEPQDVKIVFSRIVQSEKIEKLVQALVNAKVGFRYDPSSGYGSDARAEINLGWYAPSLEDLTTLLNAHGFAVERKNRIVENSQDITELVMKGLYVPEPEKEAAQA